MKKIYLSLIIVFVLLVTSCNSTSNLNEKIINDYEKGEYNKINQNLIKLKENSQEEYNNTIIELKEDIKLQLDNLIFENNINEIKNIMEYSNIFFPGDYELENYLEETISSRVTDLCNNKKVDDSLIYIEYEKELLNTNDISSIIHETIQNTAELVNEFDLEKMKKLIDLEKSYFSNSKEVVNICNEILENYTSTCIDNNDYSEILEFIEFEEEYFENSKSISELVAYDLSYKFDIAFSKSDCIKCNEIALQEEKLLQKTMLFDKLYTLFDKELDKSLKSNIYEDVKIVINQVNEYTPDYIDKVYEKVVSSINSYIRSLYIIKEYQVLKTKYEEAILNFGELFEDEQYIKVTRIPDAPMIMLDRQLFIDRTANMSIKCSNGETIYYSLNGSIPTENDNIYNENIELSNGTYNITANVINQYGNISETTRKTITIREGNYYWLYEDRENAEYKRFLRPNNDDPFKMLKTFPISQIDKFNQINDDPFIFNNYEYTYAQTYYRFIIKYLAMENIHAQLLNAFRNTESIYNGEVARTFESESDFNDEAFKAGYVTNDARISVFEDIEYTALAVHMGYAGIITKKYPNSTVSKKIDAYISAINKIEPEMTERYFKEILPNYLFNGILLEQKVAEPAFTEGRVPNFIGENMSKDEIVNSMKQQGAVHINVIEEYSDYIEVGTVISQNAFYGSIVSKEQVYEFVLSKGSSPEHYNEIVSLIEEKGWSDELRPYIISSIRFLINNTYMSKDEVIKRIDDNVSKIYFGSIGTNDGIYNYKDIVLNQAKFYEKVVIHELVHALSYNGESKNRKLGFTYGRFSEIAGGITEGYTDYIASKSLSYDTQGTAHVYADELLTHAFVSQAYSHESGILYPMIMLIGEDKFEKIFFGSIEEADLTIKEINAIYGNEYFENCIKYMGNTISHKCNLSQQENIAIQYENAILYFDKIIEGLLIKSNTIKSNDLVEFSDLIFEMYMYLPSNIDKYKKSLDDLTLATNKKLEDIGLTDKVKVINMMIIPDYSIMKSIDVERYLHAYGFISEMSIYEKNSTSVELGYVINISAKKPGSSKYVKVKPGDLFPYGCIFYITTSIGS